MTAYNEEAAIAETVRDCGRVLDGIPGQHGILVVNDGCTDRTGQILEGLTAQEPRLRVLVHRENRGIARALAWLIEEAEGDVIFYTASDGQWRADELNKMLRKYAEGFDIVIGVRRMKQYNWYRTLVSWSYNALVRLLFGKNFHDLGSIVLARAAVLKRIPTRSTSAFFVAEKVILAHRNGARVGFVGVDHISRASGRSKFDHPLRAVEAFAEVIGFWLSARSRIAIDLSGDEAYGQGRQGSIDELAAGRG